MMRREFRFAAVLSLLWLGLIAPAGFVSALFAAEEPSSTATRPEARTDDGWVARQKSFNDRVAQGDTDLLLIGDSITQGWEGEGKGVWAKYYAPRKAVNLGIGGDRTQHVLWRLDHGNLDGIKPKLAVLMIGTNNSNGNDNTAEEIGAGIRAIVARLREKLPETKVLILAVFPAAPNRTPSEIRTPRPASWPRRPPTARTCSTSTSGPSFSPTTARSLPRSCPTFCISRRKAMPSGPSPSSRPSSS